MLSTLLHQLPLFNQVNFTAAENKLLKQYFKIRTFKKKEKILSSGQIEYHFNFVFKGLVRQYYVVENKTEINTQFSAEGDLVCSAFSYFSGTPSDYISEAVETTTLLSIQLKDMDFIMAQGSNFIQFGKLLMTQLFSYKEEREKKYLGHDATKRIGLFLKLKPGLVLRLPQIYIASYLNVKPETLSKLKKGLKQKVPQAVPTF